MADKPAIPCLKQTLFWHSFIDDYGLTGNQLKLYLHIFRRAGYSGECWSSAQSMADHCRVTRRSILSLLGQLESLRMITVSKKAGHTHRIQLRETSEWVQRGKGCEMGDTPTCETRGTPTREMRSTGGVKPETHGGVKREAHKDTPYQHHPYNNHPSKDTPAESNPSKAIAGTPTARTFDSEEEMENFEREEREQFIRDNPELFEDDEDEDVPF